MFFVYLHFFSTKICIFLFPFLIFSIYWHLYFDSRSRTFKNTSKQITFFLKIGSVRNWYVTKFGQWYKNKNVVSDLFTCLKKKCKFTYPLFISWLTFFFSKRLIGWDLKVSKNRKQNTNFYHPPKNQRNFVHFFALASKKWLKQKIKASND